MPTVNETLQDKAISHAIGVQRFGTISTRRAITLLSRTADRITARLSRTDITDLSRKRLTALLDNISKIVNSGYSDISEAIFADFREFAAFESDFQLDLLKRTIPVELETVKPAAAQIWAAVKARPFEGRFLKDWFKDAGNGTIGRVHSAIQMGFIEGRTTDQIIREIRGTRQLGFKDGLMQISRRGAEAATRTALNHVANVSRETTYAANSDLIKGVRWVSTLDGRTSAICRSLDGNVYDIDKGPRPPAHINCRSTTTPIVKSWKELGINLREAPEGTRASMNGQVPATETYGTWLRKKGNTKEGRDFQDDVLGKSKGQLFRKGKLDIDRFTDRKGQEYTLDQLRVKESDAFEKAGLVDA